MTFTSLLLQKAFLPAQKATRNQLIDMTELTERRGFAQETVFSSVWSIRNSLQCYDT